MYVISNAQTGNKLKGKYPTYEAARQVVRKRVRKILSGRKNNQPCDIFGWSGTTHLYTITKVN